MANGGKYPFPYNTVLEGQKDNWKKLVGHELIKVLRLGWYQLMNRKERNQEGADIREAAREDPEFAALLEKAKAKVKARKAS